jgi:hypothetical protein
MAEGRIAYFSKRSIDPATLSCWKLHSKSTAPMFPTDRFSPAANCSSSSLRSLRIRKLTCAFHSPIVRFNTLRLAGSNETNVCLQVKPFILLSCPLTRRSYYTTSARCLATRLSARFLGLGRPTALALLAFSLQLAKVFRASLGDLLPTLPSKLDSGGIFLLRQNSEGLALVS